MAYEFKLPDLGEGVREGEIVEWLVEPGKVVAEDDPMVEVETDKATVQIPCPVDGTIAELHAGLGDSVAVGALLITIATDDDELAAPATTASPPPAVAAVKATPGARRAAKQLGLDLATLSGSGPGGAVTERDVREGGGGAVAAPPAGRREPLLGLRRRIAERLTQSHREVPKVTVVEECDFTKLAAERGEISYVPFVVRAVIAGLVEYPDFNATLEGEEIVYLERHDIGFAAQGPKGLLVPVLRDAGSKSIKELDAEVARLGAAVREETIAAEDLRGGTFTVTLAGRLGGYFATPLVNLGEAAILGVHRIEERPVVREGEIVIRKVGLVSCSFDHRITDGTRASMFLLRVIAELERGAG
ncbi:MAG TPA: dihydrolipoamide acetyltransferase family protein [Solirubrobacterales bacterium]|nr:dihydrolipoamide acetyltransferase family protein [Solirubrobacterales bacterium]